MAPLKSRGVPPHLIDSPPASAQAQRAQVGAVPDDGVVRQAQQAGTEAAQAGAEGDGPQYGPGANRSNIPGGVGSLIAPPDWNVP